MKFCNQCGAPLELKVPEGDDRERHVCTGCSAIHYRNPRIITGCLPVFEDSVLLCRRAIEPRSGYWTLPAGFLENGESLVEGAIRETWEEACADVDIVTLYGIIDILHISQIYVFYLAKLKHLNFNPGLESLETRLFKEQEIPWRDLAFPSVDWILKHYFADLEHGEFGLKTDIMDASRALYKVNRGPGK